MERNFIGIHLNNIKVSVVIFLLVVSLRLNRRNVTRYTKSQTKAIEINKEFDIVHVTSMYKVANCDEKFCPFNQEQSVAIESMKRAQKKAFNSSLVILATPTFKNDSDIVPEEFYSLPTLERSAATAYKNITKELPFIQDVFDSILKSNLNFKYVVYTNSDIILNENFYHIVSKQIAKGYDAFTINRRTVNAINSNTGDLYTAHDLDDIFKLPFEEHPGHDCFVMKKEILKQINMCDIFIGTPPFARALLMQLNHYAVNYHEFVSNDLNATYHLGDERIWKSSSSSDNIHQNVFNACYCNLCFEVL